MVLCPGAAASCLRWSRARSRCRWVCGCPLCLGAGPAALMSLLDRVRGRAGAAVSWSPRDASPAEGAAGAPRTAFALHVGQPGETGVRVPGGATHEAVGRLPPPRHGSARTGRTVCWLSVRVLAAWPIEVLGFLALSTRTTPKRARHWVDAAAPFINYRRAKLVPSGSKAQPTGARAPGSHLAAPCDAARLAWVPP